VSNASGVVAVEDYPPDDRLALVGWKPLERAAEQAA